MTVGSTTTEIGDDQKKSIQDPGLSIDKNVVKWFNAVYAVKSTRINKVYKDNGTLEIKGQKMELKNFIGKVSEKLNCIWHPFSLSLHFIFKSIGSTKIDQLPEFGLALSIGGYDVQVSDELPAAPMIAEALPSSNIRTYSVIYGTASSKMHKSYTNDGELIVNGQNVTLQNAYEFVR